MYVCMYVCMCVCGVMSSTCSSCTHACTQNDTVKIVSVDHVLTVNVAHQTIEAQRKGSIMRFEAQADLEETRKRRGRGLVHKSGIFL